MWHGFIAVFFLSLSQAELSTIDRSETPPWVSSYLPYNGEWKARKGAKNT
jgi:hypothetical protein